MASLFQSAQWTKSCNLHVSILTCSFLKFNRLALLENTAVTKLNVSLEKLTEKQMSVRPAPQPLVQHIQRIQIQAPPSPSAPIDQKVYDKAVEILRKIAPNLQTVTLIGGYMFKPTNEVSSLI